MTPTELKMKLLKKFEELVDQYMDGLSDDPGFQNEVEALIDTFIDEHEEL